MIQSNRGLIKKWQKFVLNVDYPKKSVVAMFEIEKYRKYEF